jgi:hypothetical protein
MKAVEFGRFNRIGNEATLEFVQENINLADRVELFPDERVVYLPVRWGELYHRCSEEEWRNFLGFLARRDISIVKHRWWRFWE